MDDAPPEPDAAPPGERAGLASRISLVSRSDEHRRAVDHHSERTQPEDLGVELLGTGGVRVHEFALLEALFDLLVAVQPDPLAGIDRLLGPHNTWRAILEPEI